MKGSEHISLERLWRFAEGETPDTERVLVERQLKQDEGLLQQLTEIKLLHTQLQQIEPDSPSMRFTQNVMDKLPAIYGIKTTVFQLSLKAKWIVSLCILSVIVIGAYFASAGTVLWMDISAYGLPQVPKISFPSLLSWSGSSYASIAAAVSIVLAAMIFIDQRLNSRMKKGLMH